MLAPSANNMDRLLARLERRLGRYAVPNLITYVVGGMAIAWVLSFVRPEVIGRISFDAYAVRHGQIWRLVTFLFVPPGGNAVLVLIDLYFTWWVGSTLEESWGSFKFDAYYLFGVGCTVVAGLLTVSTSHLWLDAALFLALATTAPDLEVLLFFVLPVRVKWLGIAVAVLSAGAFFVSDASVRAAIVAAMAAYAIFFGAFWAGVLRQRRVAVRQKARREQFRSAAPVFGQRVCAVCGAREAEGADIRVCSCEVCGGKPRTLCLEHARTHRA